MTTDLCAALRDAANALARIRRRAVGIHDVCLGDCANRDRPTCSHISRDLTGRCFACGHVDDAIRADQAAADARHREYAKTAPPTLPPEIEAAITAAAWSIAELDRRADVMAQPEIGALRTAITSALAAAREAGRREVLEGAAGVEEAINSIECRRCGHDDPMTISEEDALLAAITADKARAVEAMRPVLSQADADALIAANDDETLAATGDTTARAVLLAALTGAGGGR